MRRHVVIVSAGAALAFGCGAKEDPLRGEAPPSGDAPAPSGDAAVPAEAERDPPAPALPTWDDVSSGHPPGATNPPMPELIVTPEGTCYKRWVSPMKRPTGPRGNRVEACTEACGTEIVCPPEAEALLEAWRAQQGDDAGE